MEIKLQCGDTITIPDGCKAIVKDWSVVFEKEEKEEVQEFKDGDVLTSRFDNKIVFIFKEGELKQKDNRNNYYVCHTADYVIDVPTRDNWFFCGYKKDVRLATENEKQFLFDKMKEKGLQWNAGEKRVEKIRWRAKYGEKYFVVRMDDGIYSSEECNDEYDNSYYNAFNYFRTEEQTKEAARRVKETLRKYHEEIGE